MERRTLKRKKFRKERSMKLFSSGTSIVVEKELTVWWNENQTRIFLSVYSVYVSQLKNYRIS
jgi:hypothetical protein